MRLRPAERELLHTFRVVKKDRNCFRLFRCLFIKFNGVRFTVPRDNRETQFIRNNDSVHFIHSDCEKPGIRAGLGWLNISVIIAVAFNPFFTLTLRAEKYIFTGLGMNNLITFITILADAINCHFRKPLLNFLYLILHYFRYRSSGVAA